MHPRVVPGLWIVGGKFSGEVWQLVVEWAIGLCKTKRIRCICEIRSELTRLHWR